MTQAILTSSAIRQRTPSGDSPHLFSDSSCATETTRNSQGVAVSPILTATALVLLAGCLLSCFAREAGLWLSLTGLFGAAAWLLTVQPTRHSRTQEGPARSSVYTLEEKLGEGGMGVVYKARHASFERPLAVKLLRADDTRPEMARRFDREIQLTSKLSHPNTISIFDFGRTAEGVPYYAMEYVDGVDLKTLVEREGPQPPARVAHLLAQICDALAEAHGAGLIHRDIKAENLMLCDHGDERDFVKVLDFGLVKQFENQGSDLTLSDVRSVVGTPLYLSPEALIAPDSMDGRSDLYSVGVVGYFLLTGELPFAGSSLLEVCAHHLHSAPTPPSERLGRRIPAQLEELVLSCLRKSKDHRPASAAALRDALLPLAASWTRPERAPLRVVNG